MKSTLRTLLLAGTACAVLGSAAPAGAVTIYETSNAYSVANDSSQYIWQFWVTNPDAAFGIPGVALRDSWTASILCGSCGGNNTGTAAFQYTSIYGDDDSPASLLAAINPGETTGLVFLHSLFASVGHVYYVGGGDEDVQVLAASAAVPAPAALPMMGSVLGAAWLVRRWRKRRKDHASS